MKVNIRQPVGIGPWLPQLVSSIEDNIRRALDFVLPRDGTAAMTGPITFAPGASVTPAVNGQVTFELTNNTTLTVKAKGSDGTVRTATITLS